MSKEGRKPDHLYSALSFNVDLKHQLDKVRCFNLWPFSGNKVEIGLDSRERNDELPNMLKNILSASAAVLTSHATAANSIAAVAA